MKPSRESTQNRGASAHSFIEFIGVAAVLAILAATILPVFIRRVDKVALTKEISDMTAISNALVLQIQRNYAISNQNGWATMAANWALRGTSQILTNNRGFPRLFFYDNGGWMTNAPYIQTSAGTGTGIIAPVNGRIAVVSTISKALPYANGALSTANFNTLWNAAQGTVPSYLTAQGWTGNGSDLVISRISVDPLFHHLVLTTRDTVGPAGYSINSSSAYFTVTNTTGGKDAYYLDGTSVGLWSNGTLTNTFILTRDISFTFDQGMWQANLTGGSKNNSNMATNFAFQAAQFIGTSIPPNASSGTSAQSVLSSFYTFMYAYTIWATECPHFQSSASSPGQQTDYQLISALAANNGIIDATAGANGLLK